MIVQFDAASYLAVSDEGSQLPLSIVLSVPADREVTVELTTMDDSATGTYNNPVLLTIYNVMSFSASDDYSSVSQTVTFPAGETSQIIPVNTLDDSLAEETETFRAILSAPNGNGLVMSLGSPDTSTVSIVDNDSEWSSIVK